MCTVRAQQMHHIRDSWIKRFNTKLICLQPWPDLCFHPWPLFAALTFTMRSRISSRSWQRVRITLNRSSVTSFRVVTTATLRSRDCRTTSRSSATDTIGGLQCVCHRCLSCLTPHKQDNQRWQTLACYDARSTSWRTLMSYLILSRNGEESFK